MSNLSASAQAAQESARRPDGKFGHQDRPEAGQVDLGDSEPFMSSTVFWMNTVLDRGDDDAIYDTAQELTQESVVSYPFWHPIHEKAKELAATVDSATSGSPEIFEQARALVDARVANAANEQAAADLERQARARFEQVQESYERSDTDGALSQWSGDLNGQQLRAQAQIARCGGVAPFVALFDLEGKPVPAKLIQTRYGPSWGLLELDDPQSSFTGFVNPSNAATREKRVAAMANKGYRERFVLAPAKADLDGGGTGVGGMLGLRVITRRTDGGFNPSAQVINLGLDD